MFMRHPICVRTSPHRCNIDNVHSQERSVPTKNCTEKWCNNGIYRNTQVQNSNNWILTEMPVLWLAVDYLDVFGKPQHISQSWYIAYMFLDLHFKIFGHHFNPQEYNSQISIKFTAINCLFLEENEYRMQIATTEHTYTEISKITYLSPKAENRFDCVKRSFFITSHPYYCFRFMHIIKAVQNISKL